VAFVHLFAAGQVLRRRPASPWTAWQRMSARARRISRRSCSHPSGLSCWRPSFSSRSCPGSTARFGAPKAQRDGSPASRWPLRQAPHSCSSQPAQAPRARLISETSQSSPPQLRVLGTRRDPICRPAGFNRNRGVAHPGAAALARDDRGHSRRALSHCNDPQVCRTRPLRPTPDVGRHHEPRHRASVLGESGVLGPHAHRAPVHSPLRVT
jgi:hypothetical protein